MTRKKASIVSAKAQLSSAVVRSYMIVARINGDFTMSVNYRSRFLVQVRLETTFFFTKVLFTYEYTWQNFRLRLLRLVNYCVESI